MTTKIGFIGLGQMGRWMARNLLKAGFDLTVFDIDAGAMGFLVERGARAARNPAELAGLVDWVFLSLPDTAVVEQVIFGRVHERRGLVHGARHGLIIVDCSTTAYLPTVGFARRLGQQGLGYADAPVSGMAARARDGMLTVMFGGDLSIFEAVRPALEAIGSQVLYMGEAGSGQLTKLVNQLLFNISVAAIAEVLPMAVKLGLDPEKVLQVVTSSTGQSFGADFFGPRILEGRFDEGYPLQSAYKDMVSAAEICAHEGIPLPLVHAAITTYQMALAEGYGDEDKGAMIKVFERLLDVRFRKQGDEA
jgi:3-hydroxyisobutyrate dehydrogenase-like beta-hydroxyacid dehydrogenase